MGVLVGENVLVGVAVFVDEGVLVGVRVGVAELVGEEVLVGTAVTVVELVGAGVPVVDRVGDGVLVAVPVGEGVFVAVGVNVGVGELVAVISYCMWGKKVLVSGKALAMNHRPSRTTTSSIINSMPYPHPRNVPFGLHISHSSSDDSTGPAGNGREIGHVVRPTNLQSRLYRIQFVTGSSNGDSWAITFG